MNHTPANTPPHATQLVLGLLLDALDGDIFTDAPEYQERIQRVRTWISNGRALLKGSDGGLEIMHAPVISTWHIRRETLEAIQQSDSAIRMTWEHGALVFVPDDIEPEKEPADLLILYTWATSLGFHWVRLDSAGPVVPGLQTYEWR